MGALGVPQISLPSLKQSIRLEIRLTNKKFKVGSTDLKSYEQIKLDHRSKTRLSSIESQPKKLVVVFVEGIVVGGGGIVIVIVGHRNITLKFGQNRVNTK